MDIKKIAEGFGIKADTLTYTECKRGHINSTFFINTNSENKEPEYVFQRINTSIFKNPDQLMSNIFNVTSHIRNKLVAEGKDADRGVLNFIKTVDGKYCYVDDEGGYWRAYHFVGKALSLDLSDTTELFAQAGFAFGHFQNQLADFDASKLYETIPNFHNTVSRLNDLKEAISKNIAGRKDVAQKEIDFVLAREDKCSYIVNGIKEGKYPLRVTHNDTKLNNVLLDEATGDGLCVVDLDTVMPGSMLYDFGDSIRFGASSAAEDETDLSKVFVRLDMFEAYTEGFIKGLDGAVTNDEIAAFPLSAYIITLEIGIRFLTDYLNGDTYFRIHRPDHNLDRARNQFKLVADMETKMDEMNKIVAKYIK